MDPKEELLNMVSSNKGKATQSQQKDDETREKMERSHKEFAQREKERLLQEKADEEEIKSSKLVSKIRQYYQAFPFVTDNPKSKLEKLSFVQLECEMQRIISVLNAKSALESVMKIDEAINFGTEMVLIANGVPAQGLFEFTKSDEGKQMLAQEYREFAIEWQDWLGTSKEIRYLMKTFGKIMFIIEANKKQMDVPFNEEEEKKFENI